MLREEHRNNTDSEQRFGRYRVIEPLGAGSMGAVFLARDDLLGRDVAVKTVHVVGVPEFQAEMFRARFMNEARAIAALSHPNVVPIHDMGIEDGIPYLVMELAGGRSLDATLADRGRVGLYEATAIGTQIAGALTAAHAQGILHRDVKPANILEVEPNVWKLCDFGVAHVPNSSLTLAGQFVGSPAYAAPEALQRGELSVACDVYSLAASLYEAVAGQAPYGDKGLLTPGALQRRAPPPPLAERCPNLPPRFAATIMRALAHDSGERPSAAEFARELSGAAKPSAAMLVPSTRVEHLAAWRRRRRIGVAVGGAALLLVGILIGVGASGDGAGSSEPVQPRLPYAAPTSLASGDRGLPTPAVRSRSKRQAKRWRKAVEKVEDGKLEQAARELDKILDEDPDDEEARALLLRVRAALDH